MNEQLQLELLDNPALWQRSINKTVPTPCLHTGYPNLNAILPSGGWPSAALVEIVTPQWGVGELQLLMPLMKKALQQKRWILWVSPPDNHYQHELKNADSDSTRIMIMRSEYPCNDALVSIEKALKSESCAMVIVWSDWLPNAVVRRLQIASKNGNTLSVLFRQREMKNSPADLRLQLKPVLDGVSITTLNMRGTCRRRSAYLRF